MAFPTDIGSGRVIGTFGGDLMDGSDPDQEPEIIAAEGTITLTPSIGYFTHTTDEGKRIVIGLAPVTIILNAQGEASTPKRGEPTVVDYEGVRVWANDDPRNSVTGWTWAVNYKLTAAGRDLKIDPHPIAVLTNAEVDLGRVVKVPASPGVGIPQYQAAVFRAEAAAVAAAESAASGTGGTGTVGPEGPAGPIGPQGPAGADGLSGAIGPQGPQGPIGPIGETGLAGAPGTDGTDGAPGPEGPQGIAGPTGDTGPQGPTGADGPQGIQGEPGLKGDVGPIGPAGADSTVPGPIGPQGETGATGPAGSGTPGQIVVLNPLDPLPDPATLSDGTLVVRLTD